MTIITRGSIKVVSRQHTN